MAKELAIVLSDGGINSAVIAAMAAQKYRPVFVMAEETDKPNARRYDAFSQQLKHFSGYREHVFTISPPPDAESRSVAAQNGSTVSASATRLTRMLPLLAGAARYAAHYQAAAIYVGLRVGPEPDDLAAATEYVQIWNELAQGPLGQSQLEVIAPLVDLEPWQVIDVAFQVSAPLEATWSCDDAGQTPCWACPGCRTREAAFQRAARPDPLRTAKRR